MVLLSMVELVEVVEFVFDVVDCGCVGLKEFIDFGFVDLIVREVCEDFVDVVICGEVCVDCG